jgi:hypothetical protein
MTDENPTPDVLDPTDPPPVEVIPDPEPDPEPDPTPDNDRPGFVDEILDRLDGIAERLTAGTPEVIAPVVEPVVEPDTSPSRKPWTHRKFGRRD